MLDFFDGMLILEKTYWITALVGSAVFFIIFLMTILGGDIDGDMEIDSAEFDLDDGGLGFQFFSFKNVVAFFTVFGWTGVTCIDYDVSSGLTLFTSITAGLIMMFLTGMMFYQIHKLAESGTLKINNAIGEIGEVYLPIKANRANIGKISIKVQGSLRELEAITDSEEDLTTNTVIKVVEVISAELLLVEKLTK